MTPYNTSKIATALLNGDLISIGGVHYDIDDVLQYLRTYEPETMAKLEAAAYKVAEEILEEPTNEH